MNTRQIILLTFFFLILFILFELFLPTILSNKIFSYLVLGVGFIMWIISFRDNKSNGVFWGSFIFFSGIVFYVISSFEIWNPQRMFFPAVIVAAGLASFITFINTKKKFYLILSVILLLPGLNLLYARMSLKFSEFFNAIPNLIISIGIFIAIIVFLFLFLFNKKQSSMDYESDFNKSEDKIEY